MLKQHPVDLVVLMDVQMPAIGGLEATALIREKEKRIQQHVFIIAATASAMKVDQERCFAAGMDGYVSKPIQSEALNRVIQKFHQHRASSEAQHRQ